MAGIASYMVIQFLAANEEPKTQQQIAEALGFRQSTVSRTLRETPGIVRNDSVRPALFTFDASLVMDAKPVEESGSYTGVIRPDGSILIGNSLFAPVTDTLADRSNEQLLQQLARIIGAVSSKGGFKSMTKGEIEELAATFDKTAHTLRCRIEKGDFDG